MRGGLHCAAGKRHPERYTRKEQAARAAAPEEPEDMELDEEPAAGAAAAAEEEADAVRRLFCLLSYAVLGAGKWEEAWRWRGSWQQVHEQQAAPPRL